MGSKGLGATSESVGPLALRLGGSVLLWRAKANPSPLRYLHHEIPGFAKYTEGQAVDRQLLFVGSLNCPFHHRDPEQTFVE